MAEILAGCAFILALAAVWFTGAGLRRMEKSNQALIKAHLQALRTAASANGQAIEGLDNRLAGLEKLSEVSRGARAGKPLTEVA